MSYNVIHLHPFSAPILINIGVPIISILAFLCNIIHVCSGLYECLFCVEGVKNYSYSNLSTLYFGVARCFFNNIVVFTNMYIHKTLVMLTYTGKTITKYSMPFS